MIVRRLVRRAGHRVAVCTGCAAMFAGYAGLAVWHGALWQVVAANAVSNLGIGLVASAMAMVLTERAGTASTGIAVGMYITARAIGGSMAGAGFAALLRPPVRAEHKGGYRTDVADPSVTRWCHAG